MLAAQVNARKHDKLRMILGFDWIWCLGLCEALLGWVLIAAAVAGRAFGLIWAEDPPPPFACWPEPWVPIALCSDLGRWLDARRIAFVLCASGGPLSRMRGSAVAALVI